MYFLLTSRLKEIILIILLLFSSHNSQLFNPFILIVFSVFCSGAKHYCWFHCFTWLYLLPDWLSFKAKKSSFSCGITHSFKQSEKIDRQSSVLLMIQFCNTHKTHYVNAKIHLYKKFDFFLRKMGQIRWLVLSKFVLRFIDYTHRHMEQAMHMWFMWCVQKKMIVLIIAEKRKKKTIF